MASSRRSSSRSSSSSNLNSSLPGAANGQLGCSEQQGDFDLGSFTFITDDDLDFEQPRASEHLHHGSHAQTPEAALQPHYGGHGKNRAPQAQSSHRLLFSAKSRSKSSRIAAAGAKQADSVRNKLQAAWNKVKYGWMVKSRASFGGNSPVVLLGNVYISSRPSAVDSSDDDSQLSGDAGGVDDLPAGGAHDMVAGADLKAFQLDFESRIWLTYRRDFPRIADSPFTTDCGWGCMLRCGQMALAQALVVHFLGRHWRRPPPPLRRRSSAGRPSLGNNGGGGSSYELTSTPRSSAAVGGAGSAAPGAAALAAGDRQAQFRYRFIVSCLMDSPSAHSPFSLHRLVQLGAHYGKKAGDWYGPGSTANIIQEAVARSSLMYPVFGDVCVYVARDCTIYKQDVIDLCRQQQRRPSTASASHRLQRPAPHALRAGATGGSGSRDSIDGGIAVMTMGAAAAASPVAVDASHGGATWRSVIIFVPVRLGGERLNELYVQCLQGLLSLEHCIGIMGGRPRHSLYFVGFQDEQLIYLDPHLCQDSLDPKLAGDTAQLDTSSYHCRTPRKLAFSDMDPSCTIGFYCRDEADFAHFLTSIEPYLILPGQRSRYPLFLIDDGSLQAATVHSRAAAAAAGRVAAGSAAAGSAAAAAALHGSVQP